jgi:hypothetical protein
MVEIKSNGKYNVLEYGINVCGTMIQQNSKIQNLMETGNSKILERCINLLHVS